MKRISFVLATLLLGLCACKKQNESTPIIPEGRITSYEVMSRYFQDPPAGYRTAPFWVWNTRVTKEKIDQTLSDFKNKGMGGAFLHPRYGLITEYLSNEWFELVDYAVKKGEELDLNIWIYDENSFPSGFAGGHVAAQMPEANSEGVALKPYFMDVLHIPEEADRPLHVFSKEKQNWIEITKQLADYINKKGEYCVLDLNDYETSKWFGGYSYIDLLKPGVTEKFIEITMPGYEKVVGHEFGKRVPGVFTDEPNTNTRRAGPIRYTPDLYEQFEKQWGYDLQPHIMSLITETGDWKKVRHNYQSTILQLFIDRWSKPWYEYTEEKNLEWTGHYWEHGWPSPKEGPDNMAMYAWHQTPGVDMLFNNEEARPDQFGNIRNVKELSSVANQFDRHRTLSETYGAAGWSLTFDDMKRLGDWEYVLGVNFMNQHLSYMSLAGDRKHDFPQSFGPHAPYWGLYKYQADYFARLSLALSSGQQKNNILVIEPTTTAWMYYNPRSARNSAMMEVKNQFEPFLGKLEKYQVEYDLGCENIIKDQGAIHKGKFVINKAEYETVILPPGLQNLDQSTFKLVQEFADAGGSVLQMDCAPAFVDGAATSYELLQGKDTWHVIETIDETVLEKLARNDNLRFENPQGFGGDVFHHRREMEEGQLLFLTNFHKTEEATIRVKAKGKSVLEMNAENGQIKAYSFENEKDEVAFDVILHPSGSKLLFISNKKQESIEGLKTERRLLKTATCTVEAIHPNILNLDYVELSMDKMDHQPMYFYTAGNEIWKKHGYPDNPWVSSSQFKTELVDADTFSSGSGFSVEYPFYVEELPVSKNVQLVVERSHLYKIRLNGSEIYAEENKSWLDEDFRVFEVGDQLRKGKNTVQLTADPFSMFCELEPVYLLGEFGVAATEKGFILKEKNTPKMGSWKEMGMPFYGQTMSYTKQVDIDKEGDYELVLQDWKGTVAEVLVDGVHKGIIQSPPYRLKMQMPVGECEVKVNITGSLKNTLGPHHNVRTHGIVTPWSFKFAPEIQPPGNEYDLFEYGLFRDFEIYQLLSSK